MTVLRLERKKEKRKPGFTVAFARYVDCSIPCNNKGKESIALMYWLLSREVMYLRGVMPRTDPWEVRRRRVPRSCVG